MTAAAVVGFFVLLALGGYLLHQWSTRRISQSPPEKDLRDLADPDRWPAPPPPPSDESGDGGPGPSTGGGVA